jgi:hypothetical protein
MVGFRHLISVCFEEEATGLLQDQWCVLSSSGCICRCMPRVVLGRGMGLMARYRHWLCKRMFFCKDLCICEAFWSSCCLCHVSCRRASLLAARPLLLYEFMLGLSFNLRMQHADAADNAVFTPALPLLAAVTSAVV